jgi:hypothetical protein
VSKQIMQYIAAVSGNGAGVERVKNVIIEARACGFRYDNQKSISHIQCTEYFQIIV